MTVGIEHDWRTCDVITYYNQPRNVTTFPKMKQIVNAIVTKEQIIAD
jgi:hypothetical protein